MLLADPMEIIESNDREEQSKLLVNQSGEL